MVASLVYYNYSKKLFNLFLETRGYDIKHSTTRLRAAVVSTVLKKNVMGGHTVKSLFMGKLCKKLQHIL